MKLKTVLKIIYINLKIIIETNLFKKNPRPYKILIQLTNDCNSFCNTCSIWKINKLQPELKKQELSPENYQLFFSNYGKNIYWLALSGGEISLYNELDKLLEIISKQCPNLAILTFTTNGLLPEKILECAIQIKKALPKVDFFVTISLDGPEEIHDKIRGVKGNYLRVMETHQLLQKNDFIVHLGLTINQFNAEYFSSNLSKQSYIAKAINLTHSQGIYNQEVKLEDQLALKALKRIVKNYSISDLGQIVEYIFIKLSIIFLKNNRKKQVIPCEVIRTSVHLTPYGEVLPCMFLPGMGNVKTQSLIEILDKQSTLTQLENIKKEQCPKCWMNCYAPHSMMLHPLKSLLTICSPSK